MKVYIVCTCHTSCFIQHVRTFILSFDVKSKMTTNTLLPVILSELVDSDYEKPFQSFFTMSIFLSFLNLSLFLFPLYTFFGLLAFLFLLSSTSSSYSSPFCSCNLYGWSESFSLLFKLISIWFVWFFYCYYFAEYFSFVESFKIRSLIFKMTS